MQLKTYLKREGETARAFSVRAGVSIHAIRKWVRNERVPRPRTIMKIKKLTRGDVGPDDWMMAH